MIRYLVAGEGSKELLTAHELNGILIKLSQKEGVIDCSTIDIRPHSIDRNKIIFTIYVTTSDYFPQTTVKEKLETFQAIQQVTTITKIKY
ncbi:MAG TPA: hypothetical protein VIH27_01620 [Nitrososphaerales archaeon]